MSKKTLIFGLAVAVLASLVGGAFGATSAKADYVPNTLNCTPSVQTVSSGQSVTFSAFYQYSTFSVGNLTWNAFGGSPATGTGSSFTTQFSTTDANQVRTVTVSDGYQTASCTVYVNGWYPYPTYTPVPSGYVTLEQTVRNTVSGQSGTGVVVNANERVQFVTTVTTGGQYVYNVRMQDALPTYISFVPGTTTMDGVSYADALTGAGLNLGTLQPNRTYTVRFDAVAQYVPSQSTTLTNTVYLWGDNVSSLTDTTRVYLNGNDYITPTPYPYPYSGSLSLSLYGRNVSRGQTGEYTIVGIRAGETVNLVLHVRSGGYTLSNVYVTDQLPAGLNYIFGSTTLNGYVTADGITSSGLNIGALGPNQEAIVRFSVRADGSTLPTWGTVSVFDTAQARADSNGTVSAQVQLNLGGFISSVSSVKTGPADSLLLALIIAALATGIYAVYAQSDLFGKRMALAEIAKLRGKNVNFAR